MKTLVVYYSFEGNTRLIAHAIAQSTGADIQELVTEDQPKSRGFSKYFWGGRQVMTRQRPKLMPLEKNAADYDVIFIGTPVWAFRPAPAMSSFLESVRLTGKKIALFCCSGGGMGRTLEIMKTSLEGNVFLSTIHFVEPKRTRPEVSEERAGQWAKDVLSKT